VGVRTLFSVDNPVGKSVGIPALRAHSSRMGAVDECENGLKHFDECEEEYFEDGR